MTPAPRVIVVGGGLAGLTAALDCADAGAEVTLLEGRPRLGGAAGSAQRHGMAVDTGQHVFLRCCTAYRGLLARIEAAEGVVVQPRLHVPVLLAGPAGVRPARLRRTRAGLPPPWHLGASLLGYRALTPRERLSAAGAARALARLDPADPAVDATALGAWLRARGQGPRSVAGLWEVLTVATLNTPVAEASLALAATVVRRGLFAGPGDGDIGWARVPLGELHDRAARTALARAGVQVRTRSRVQRLLADPVEPRVLLEGAELAGDAVVLAVGPRDAARLLPEGPARQAAGALGESPIVNVHLRYDRRVAAFPPDAPFTAAVGSPAQWVFDRTAAAGLGSGQYLAVSLSAADTEVAEPAATLTQRYARELARLFPAARQARLLDAFVTREPAATIRQPAGVASLRPAAETGPLGVVLAGAWTDTGWPATMEGAVRSGHRAAAAVLARSREAVRA